MSQLGVTESRVFLKQRIKHYENNILQINVALAFKIL